MERAEVAAWLRRAIPATVLVCVILAACSYILRPHVTVRFFLDSQRLESSSRSGDPEELMQVAELSTGEHSLVIVARNFGLPLKNVMVILGVDSPPNATRVFTLEAHTKPTRMNDLDLSDTHSFITWNHTRLGFLSKRIHNVSINVSQPAVIYAGAIMYYPWRGYEPGFGVAKTLLQMEFS